MFGTTINPNDIPECGEPIRSSVITSAQGPLIEGQSIMYLQVVFDPFPRLQTCKVTIGPDDARP